jgi:hypothetical protein
MLQRTVPMGQFIIFAIFSSSCLRSREHYCRPQVLRQPIHALVHYLRDLHVHRQILRRIEAAANARRHRTFPHLPSRSGCGRRAGPSTLQKQISRSGTNQNSPCPTFREHHVLSHMESGGEYQRGYSYRLTSSKNPFGSGGNLQTIPSEKSKSAVKAAARGSMDFPLPNNRSIDGSDIGFTFFDMDLDRADLQVVVWESGEQDCR